jgi:alpha-glucosidase
MYKILLLLAIAGFYHRSEAQPLLLTSPDKQISVKCFPGRSVESLLTFTLSMHNSIALSGAIGLRSEITGDVRTTGTDRYSISSPWSPLYGERSVIPDLYNAIAIRFASKQSPGDSIIIYCRLYNEGLAYRYEVIKRGNIRITRETSFFVAPRGSIGWTSKYAQSPITAMPIDQIRDTVERPLTLKTPNAKYMALGEAALTDYARMKFAGSQSDTLFCALDGSVEAVDKIISPWRFALIANTAGELLTKNYLLENLNETCAIANTDWIKPGKILREVTLSTAGALNAIDFAARHNIRYICFDAGWYGKEDSDTSDATRVSLDPARARGSLALDSVIAYGRRKNVGVFLYVNRRALERQLDTLLPLFKSWGVKGIKFGFVQVGSQSVTKWLHDAIAKAARFELMVDVHDEYRPTGVSRTYPNLLTQEGVRGDEESPLMEHTIKTIFTRMIAGAADNTNCYFTERVDKMGSHVAQMAKTICIYSPLQFVFWYDRPAAGTATFQRPGQITEIPDLDWYDKLPTTWNETRIIEGDINSYVTIARRSGEDWFLGTLNGTRERTFVTDTRFLNPKFKYRAVIFVDNPELDSYTRVEKRIENVDVNSKLTFRIQARHGIAIRFERI